MTKSERKQLKYLEVELRQARNHLVIIPPAWGTALEYVTTAQTILTKLIEEKPDKKGE